MVRVNILFVFLLAIGTGSAQYDVGVSLGAYGYEMRTGSRSRGGSGYGSAQALPIIASLWYRERGENWMRFGLEIQWTRKVFHANYSTGGLGFGTNYRSDIRIDLLHVNVLPEVRIDRSGQFLFRIGPQFGFLVGGSEAGSFVGWSMLSSGTSGTIGGEMFHRHFKGDIRWLMSFGYCRKMNDLLDLSVDPYFSLGLGSIRRIDPYMNYNEFGVKLSLGLRIDRRSFWRSLRKGAPG